MTVPRRPGRPARTDTKAAPLWCGQQMIGEMRKLILDYLTADERFQALLNAALKKKKAPKTPPSLP